MLTKRNLDTPELRRPPRAPLSHALEMLKQDETVARKRPKSMEGNGHHLPCPVKSGNSAAPTTPVEVSGSRSPVESGEAAADTAIAAGGNGPDGVAGVASPMEGVVFTPSAAASATAAAAATAVEAASCAATHSVHPPGAPPECPPVQTNTSCPGSTPVSQRASDADCGASPDAKAHNLPCPSSCGATAAAVAGGVAAAAAGGASSPLQGVVGSDDGKAAEGGAAAVSAPATTAVAAAVAAQEREEGNATMPRVPPLEHSAGALGEGKAGGGSATAGDVGGTVAAGAAGAVASPGGCHDAAGDGVDVKMGAAGPGVAKAEKQEGVDADVGAEAAGDASRGSAASDNFDVS